LARTPESGSEVHRERHREVLETAARLIREQGYEAASVQDIAAACGLTKAGLYYYIRSKEDLLLEIMSYGMDIFEERVLLPVLAIADPVERLKACMERNIHLVTEERSKEVTVILHEHETLTGAARQQINARKKRYVHFLEASFEEAMREGRIRRVEPRVAAFSFLGMVLWIYKWFRRDGKIPADRLAAEMQDLFFGGLEIPPAPASRPRRPRRPRSAKAPKRAQPATDSGGAPGAKPLRPVPAKRGRGGAAA
jgi:TetR/AcrR family transcriptional regulator, cholesterol catabolism regulator